MLSFGKEAKQSQLLGNKWTKDTSEHFDSTAEANAGFTLQKFEAAGSHDMDMLGKIHLDMCFQNRYLLNGVEMKLRFIRFKSTFCLQGVGNFKVSLKDVSL